MPAYSAEFEDQVRDLLASFDDYLKLANNPVARRLARDASGSQRMSVIQETALRAIEALRPEAATRPSQRQERLYHLLKLRYIDKLSTTAVIGRLALSERQYYREHQRALQTISRVIWDRHFAAPAPAEPASQSLAQELDYLNIANRGAVIRPRAEIEAAIAATAVVAAGRDIAVSLRPGDDAIRLNASQPVFRQLIIFLLNELIGATAPGGEIALELESRDVAPTLALRATPLGEAGDALCTRLNAPGPGRELTRGLKAELSWDSQGQGVALRFAGGRHKVLIVDDNPDSVRLFRRYLRHQPYQILAAAGEAEATRIARGTRLLCIILDVMLPGKDGWQLLQAYKSHPATADVPVLICSVLEMEALARSLGADGYLKKPPARDALLAALGQWAG